MRKLNNLLKKISILLMPQRCPFCCRVIEQDQTTCKRCEKDIPVHAVFQGVKGSYKCSSAFLYSGKFKRAVINFKFNHKKQYSPQLAFFLSKCIEQNYPDMVFDCITYVPMHNIAEKKRGYNQCELLAKDLSKLMNLPCHQMLIKTKATKPQHSLNAKLRSTNLNGAFKVSDKKLVKGKSILLIDDIVTTGSTLGECAKTLQKAKPSQICCATVLASANLY